MSKMSTGTIILFNKTFIKNIILISSSYFNYYKGALKSG